MFNEDLTLETAEKLAGDIIDEVFQKKLVKELEKFYFFAGNTSISVIAVKSLSLKIIRRVK